jgi:hypothetical protein
LYAALSLMQMGDLESSLRIIEKEFLYSRSLPIDQDPKLTRICQGIFAKWKYQKWLKEEEDSETEEENKEINLFSIFD